MIDQIRKRLTTFRDERDWSQFHTPRNLATSVAVEAAELLEVFQWHTEDTLDLDSKKIEGEVADVAIYLIMFCDEVGIDLERAINRKIDLNEQRFPIGVSRGKSKPLKD